MPMGSVDSNCRMSASAESTQTLARTKGSCCPDLAVSTSARAVRPPTFSVPASTASYFDRGVLRNWPMRSVLAAPTSVLASLITWPGVALWRNTQTNLPSATMRSPTARDRKSTRLNSSHSQTSYGVVCLTNQERPENDEDLAGGLYRPVTTPAHFTNKFHVRLFLFCGSTPGGLPSFPTRRSSDLSVLASLITWPGVALWRNTQTNLPSATVRSPTA